MHLDTLSQIIYNFITSGAVITGGVWAYFKFIRGRTFSYRAEPSITLSAEERNNLLYLHATITLKNTGLSKLPLNEDMKYFQVSGMVSSGVNSPVAIEWKLLFTGKIFDQHAWVEAQETATDTVVLYMRDAESGADCCAYKVEALLGTPRARITRKGHLWHARAVVFSPASPTKGQTIAVDNSDSALVKRLLHIGKRSKS